MKIHIGIALTLCAICAFLGAKANEAWTVMKYAQRVSEAGETLSSLREALEKSKQDSGSYPSSIQNIKVIPRSGDFSAKMLKNMKYFKTEQGFIAFIGLPQAAYILPDTNPRFE